MSAHSSTSQHETNFGWGMNRFLGHCCKTFSTSDFDKNILEHWKKFQKPAQISCGKWTEECILYFWRTSTPITGSSSHTNKRRSWWKLTITRFSKSQRVFKGQYDSVISSQGACLKFRNSSNFRYLNRFKNFNTDHLLSRLLTIFLFKSLTSGV